MIHMDLRQVEKLISRMGKMPEKVDKRIVEVVDAQGKLLLQTTIRNASGRPGPNVVTGNYINSFVLSSPSKYTRVVSNGSPQARRLEYGFIGVDSLGRHYVQPPFPHMAPAKEEVGPVFLKAMMQVPGQAWRDTK